MLKTKAEFATLRLNEDLKPYMSRYLSDLVSHMVEKYQPSSRTKRLIELCCRDFEFSSEHVDGPSWSVLGIDLKRPSAASFEFEDRVYNEATDEWDYVPACVCKNRVKVPTSTFTAIEENIFLYDYEQDAASHTYESTLIYCRPPELRPLSQFPASIDAANARVLDFLRTRSKQLQRSAGIPDLLSVTEWYYIFLAASIACSQSHTTAVIQISDRLFNLARAVDGRRLLCDLGLLKSIVLLPNTIAKKAEGRALLFIGDGEPNDPYFLFDGRSFDDKQMTDEILHQLLDSVDRAYGDQKNPVYWHRLEDQGNGIYPLLPNTKSGSFDERMFIPLGSLAPIYRGTARSVVTKLPESDPTDSYQQHDCYYLSLKHLHDGAIIAAEDVLERVPDTDIYDVSRVDYEDFRKAKPIDAREASLLISRVGPPFKLALITPGHFSVGSERPVERGLLFESIVPCDAMFCATFEDELLAQFVLAYLSSDEGQKKLADTSHGDALVQLAPMDLRSMTVPVPGRAEQERYALEYEAKQRAYEDALKQAEHYAASKGTM